MIAVTFMFTRAVVRELSFGLQPILLGVPLWMALFFIEALSILGYLFARQLGFGRILDCVFVFLHEASLGMISFLAISTNGGIGQSSVSAMARSNSASRSWITPSAPTT